MRQSRSFILLTALAAALAGGCDRAPGTAATRPAAPPGGIISLTPAGTDLLVAMGLGGRVVGVSPYEANDTLRDRLPKVGDYARVDWERLSELRPAYLLMQGKIDRLPAGVLEHCRDLGVTPVVLQIDRLDDIAAAVKQIGEATHEPAATAAATAEIDRRRRTLESSRPRTPVPSLVMFGDGGSNAVGRETFVDDALSLAGGVNVVERTGYVTLDTERLASLRPRAVFLLIPGGSDVVVGRATDAVVAAGLPGVTRESIYPVTAADTLMPGTAAYSLAETFGVRLAEVRDRARAARTKATP